MNNFSKVKKKKLKSGNWDVIGNSYGRIMKKPAELH